MPQAYLNHIIQVKLCVTKTIIASYKPSWSYYNKAYQNHLHNYIYESEGEGEGEGEGKGEDEG